jgi:putative DNA primase/helicase
MIDLAVSLAPAARELLLSGLPSEWPDPAPLQSDLPPVDSFDLGLLPSSFRPLAGDIAERMQVPVDYPAVAQILCLAGVIGRRALIQPKANDSGWVVLPNLWGGIVAPPGFMKTPVIAAATRPLMELQAEWRREHQAALRDYQRQKEEHELRRQAWREQFKAKTKSNAALPERPGDEPVPPALRRLLVNDATFEKLHEHMSENPAGIFVVRDELTGWLSQLDKPGREGERAFCLQAWNGDTGHTIDRIGRGTIHVEACCMTLLGGIQPSRLQPYMQAALKDGPGNDGLLQRFQVLTWPDKPSSWEYVDRAPDPRHEYVAARVFRALVNIDATDPLRFRFSPDAQALFVEWYSELEPRLRNDDLHPALQSHLAKYRKLMPALALQFELADMAASGTDSRTISLEHARQAAACCDYFESHARRLYFWVSNPQLRAAGELARRIKRQKIGESGSFCVRDVYLKGWGGLDSPEAVKQAAQVLEDAAWIRELDSESGPKGGRPSMRFEINPKVLR